MAEPTVIPEVFEPPCMLCGGGDFTIVAAEVKDVVFRKPGTFGIQRCNACDLVMTRPRPKDLGFYYDEAYSGGAGLAELKRSHDARLDSVVRQRLDVISTHLEVTADSHLLDVGCSNGGLLMHARNRWSCSTTGVDFDAAAFDQAFEPDRCTYLAGTLQTLELPAASFDAVLFLESLEHDPDPVQSLRLARDLLTPGGIVVVEVPNYDGALRPWFGRYWLPYLIPQHTVHFTPATLKATFEKAGLEVLEVRSMNFALEGVLSLLVAYAWNTSLPPVGSPPGPRLLLDVPVFLLLAVVFVLIELPLQWLLARIGRSGHQTVVGRVQVADGSGMTGHL